MAAKKKPAKKAAAKKKPSTRRTGGRTNQLPVPEPDRTPEDITRIVEEADAKAPLWQEAWRMQCMGVPARVIAERLDVKSATTALRYADNWVRLLEGDPLRANERARILARLDDMADTMTKELRRLEAAEDKKPADKRAPVWLDNSKPLLDVLALRWRIVAPRDQGKKQVTVEVGAATQTSGFEGVPSALGAVLARVTVTDSEDAA